MLIIDVEALYSTHEFRVLWTESAFFHYLTSETKTKTENQI